MAIVRVSKLLRSNINPNPNSNSARTAVRTARVLSRQSACCWSGGGKANLPVCRPIPVIHVFNGDI